MSNRRIAALDQLMLVTHLLSADLERYVASHGLTTSRVQLLWHLGRLGPCQQRDLAAALEVSPRNVTGLVDGLVDTGFVTRESHPTDRRATLVTPTRKGSQVMQELADGQVELAGQLFGELSDRQLATLTRMLCDIAQKVVLLMEQEAAR